MTQFTHLHVHTEYSLLDGAARIVDLVAKAKANGQTALAITDHGCMYGVVSFYKECVAQGVKPIIGMETYVAPRNRRDKQGKMDREYAHLILLAKDQAGYHNLCELSTQAFTEGYYYRPRIDYDLLFQKSEGLVVLSACLAGDLSRLLMDGQFDEAKDYVMRMKEHFGEDFYIEVQDHGIPEQREILPDMLRLCRECGVKPVATNDVHYVNREDAAAQDALLCIQTQRYLDETDRMRMVGEEFYLKSTEEMLGIFPNAPEAIANTQEIVDKCDVSFSFGALHLPNYDVPEGYDHEGYLRKLCVDGLQAKCGDKGSEYRQRLEYELEMIRQMGYTDYFLIVWDFIDFAKGKNIEVGPGRGSAAGSLAAYCLGITDIDPIQYSLIFERFLNPERITMPDIDIDFCYERRQEVIDYVVEKYGADHVAQIITFGTMGAKQAVRDVGRVMRVPYGEVDRLAKMIPFELNMTLERALKISPELRRSYETEEIPHKLIDLALKVEGLPRHASTHAAGVVISAKPLVEYLPLQTNDDAITTQFPMGTIEELGLLKMDFLGLRTLTVIRDTLEEIMRQGATPPCMETLPYDDPKVYALLSAADTAGVFQLESGGMRAFMMQLKPDCFEDVIAGISLYRPGPMEQIPTYVERKFHPEKIQYLHPMLEPILSATYGVIVYQEQVMQIVRDLAGYSLGRSDLLRRAMSKKKKDVMVQERSAFVEGCQSNRIDAHTAGIIYDQMLDFAQYAFNKSHAAAYAVVAYRTAWLKVHYTAEFMSALMNSFLNDSGRIREYIVDCRAHGIPLLPPSVNHSRARFTVETTDGADGSSPQKAIRFGLGAIKNVGVGACESIVAEREENGLFSDFHDFATRCSDYVTKRMLEFMIQAGAMDCFGKNRSVLEHVLEQVLDLVAQEKRIHANGQFSLFDGGDEDMAATIEYPEIIEYHINKKLQMEKAATGMYITGHPLAEFERELEALDSSRALLEAGERGGKMDGDTLCIGGVITEIRRTTTRKNEQMAYVRVEDMLDSFECVVFPRVLEEYRPLLQTDSMIVVRGQINTKEDDDNVMLMQAAFPLERGAAERAKSSRGMPAQRFNGRMAGRALDQNGSTQNGQYQGNKSVKPGLYLRCGNEELENVVAALLGYPGDTPLVFAIDGKPYRDKRIHHCQANAKVVKTLQAMLGSENVKLVF